MTAHPVGWAITPPPPLHNLLLPHGPYMDVRGCPPGCQFRQWAEKYLAAPATAEGTRP
ncbi:MAG TPA: hypothetical protein VK586_09045 [Streptosporangiaceae bacterium]|nr:hypothetical protein [Streptosporangiaceae bacterium]